MKKRFNKDANNWFYVLVAFYAFFLYMGCQGYGFSLFVKPLQTHFGWDRTTIMMAFTFLMISTAITSPFVGKIIDKYGARMTISIGSFITAILYSLLSLINTPLHLYIIFAFIGIFSTSIGAIPATTIVSNSFNEKRGLAIGLSTAGVGIGALVIVPFLGMIIPEFGWKAGYLIIACIISLMTPLSLMIIKPKEKSEDIKLLKNIEPHFNGYLKKIFLSVPFVLLCATFFMNNFGVVGLTQIQVPYLQDIGFPLSVSASMIGVVGLMSAFGKFFFGWLCDRIKPKYVYTIGTSITVAGIIILMMIKPDSSPLLIWSFPVIIGFGMGSWLPALSMSVSATFPVMYYGFIFGAASVALNFGASAGPLADGKIFDLTGNYYWVFVSLIAGYCVSIVTMLALKRDSMAVKEKKQSGILLPENEGIVLES